MDIKICVEGESWWHGKSVRVEITGIKDDDLMEHAEEPSYRLNRVVNHIINILRER